MAVNSIFHTNNLTSISTERNLYKNLIKEAIQIYGHDVYYVNRTTVALDNVLGEDSISKFTRQHPIEMYVEDNTGFGGDKEIINQFVKNTKREVSIEYIQKVVSEYFQMEIATLQSKTRKRHIVQARQLAMFFAKKYTKASLASIGNQIGKRDHATVLHACKTVDNLTFTDKQFRKYVEDLNQKLTL